MLMIIQVVVPLLLIAALAWRVNARSLAIVRALSVGLYLLGVHLAGLWMDLPWWTVWLLWALFAASLMRSLTGRTASRAPVWLKAYALASWTALAALSAWLAGQAALGRIPPQGAAADLAFPLPPGQYLVVNGGSRPLVNAHLKTLQPSTPRQARYRGQSHGVDLIALRADGRPVAGWRPRDPARHAIFGVAVLAPCNGQVTGALDGRPDMPVPIPDESRLEGNHVVLRCGDVQVLLAHLRQGSVRVRAGDQVQTGQQIGEAGNSGNTDAPHLHIHAQRPGEDRNPFAADPLPLRFDGRYPVRGDRL